jgi:predicted permease
MIDSLLQDIRYALRSLRRTPAFAAAAIATLALGIGANTAIFSLMNAVMLRTLPVTAPQELYFIAHGSPGQMSTAANYRWLERVRQRDDVFAGVTAYNIRDFKVSSDDGVQQVVGQYVSGNYHALAGVPMAFGRGFSSEDDRASGSSPIAVISDAYWARRFGRDPQVLGRMLRVGAHPVTIVGVTAPGFEGLQPGRSVEITLPLSIRVQDEPTFLTWADSWTSMPLVARLKPGVDARQAQSVVQVIFREHVSQPEIRGFGRMPSGEPRTAVLLPAARGHDRLRDQYAMPLAVLMGMVGLVLLIACVNVANLLLVRGAARAREMAVRMAVGASRGRLVRQLTVESVIMAVVGGAIGLLLASWGTQFVGAFFRQSQNPVVIDLQPDGTVLLFAAAVSLVTGTAFGVMPAFKATRLTLTPALNLGHADASAARGWLGRKALVAAQIALSLVLVFGAALLVRTLRNLQYVDGGFATENVLVFTLDSLDTAVPAGRMAGLCDEVLTRLRGRAGVASASCSTMSPVGGAFQILRLREPRPPAGTDAADVFINRVTPDYFATFGVNLLRGRRFSPQDTATSPRVAILSETTSRFYFGTTDTIGRTIGIGAPQPIVVVGVVKDARQQLRDLPPRMVYLPIAQSPFPPLLLTAAIRTTDGTTPIARLIPTEVRQVSRDVAVSAVRTMRQQIEATLIGERLLATLSTAFGGLALILACIGLYGVMSYDVARRRRDIGIRLALGADRSTVLHGVMCQAAVITASGLLAGLVAASLASQLVAGFLFELTPRDPGTLGVTVLLLALTAMLAGYFPARRAARVDPVVALRAE